MIGFDPMYFLFIAPALILAVWAQFSVRSAMAAGAKVPPSSGLSGAQAAAKILEAGGIRGVGIEQTSGMLGDHYDPKAKVLRLTPEVFSGRSLTAVGVAAHEAGHALQDAEAYRPMVVRNAVVPLAGFGSNASFFLMFIGMLMSSFNLIVLGIASFSVVVFFQLVNLPVEFNASSRAKALLLQRGIIGPSESPMVSRVLGAAAMTYVAATISAVLTLIYYLFRFGLLDRRD